MVNSLAEQLTGSKALQKVLGLLNKGIGPTKQSWKPGDGEKSSNVV